MGCMPFSQISQQGKKKKFNYKNNHTVSLETTFIATNVTKSCCDIGLKTLFLPKQWLPQPVQALIPVQPVAPRQEKDNLKYFYLHQTVYNSCSFSTEQDLKERKTKRPSSVCWFLPCQISCLCTEPVSVSLVASPWLLVRELRNCLLFNRALRDYSWRGLFL